MQFPVIALARSLAVTINCLGAFPDGHVWPHRPQASNSVSCTRNVIRVRFSENTATTAISVRLDGMTSLDRVARDFLASAFTSLQDHHVLPTPVFDPYLRIGRDYFGDSLGGRRGFAALENAIAERHPRFSEETPLHERDFAHVYIYSFLEAVIAEAALKGEELSPFAPCVDSCIEALSSEIEADNWEVACCREVTHLTTTSSQPIEFSNVTIFPLVAPAHDHSREASGIIAQVIPHSQSAYGRESPGTWNPPQAIVVARGVDGKPFDLVKDLSRQIDIFLLAARLLHAATSTSVYEVQGGTSLVRQFAPTLARFRGNTDSMIPTSMLRRTTRIEPRDSQRFDGLARAIAAAEKTPKDKLVTSFGMAIHKFQLSFHAHNWQEQIVDLTTALEATLSGTKRSDVVHRLKTRATALLATGNDPAGAIFDDIGHLYEIRSQLIHGGTFSEKQLMKSVNSITTVPDTMAGTAVDHAVDRLRDLVRRALLARIALATCDPPLWRFGGDKGIDAALADDTTRGDWRSAWHGELESYDAADSVERPRTAALSLSQDDL